MNNIVCPDNLFFSFSLLELKQIMRQKDDLEYAQILCRVRKGETTTADLDRLQTACIPHLDLSPLDIHTFTTNKVSEHNECVLSATNETIYTIHALDSVRDVETGFLANEIRDNAPLTQKGNLPTVLRICRGARIMITSNIDITDELVNGSTGVVVGIIETNVSVASILIRLNNPHAGTEAKRTNPYHAQFPGTVAVERVEVHFPISRKHFHSYSKKGINVKRRQFPITLAWACTIHKMQGSTLDKIVIDMAGKIFCRTGICCVESSQVTQRFEYHQLRSHQDKTQSDSRRCTSQDVNTVVNFSAISS